MSLDLYLGIQQLILQMYTKFEDSGLHSTWEKLWRKFTLKR